ncbi:hypothetical protein CLPU_6c00540 [Gottschalkia purinilytica]|uniref:Uncharacterized protein n=1 Tax=Gottschalkia purinilytica TaxID=1503 RepID=A0A0L0WAN9_GOTPU|nr:CD1375 family protein [Gottschalkia purinilytica]KNF08568.1 hypothetical protein CLPU_6c00540 [Gottschalkia purinilytica]
MKVKEYMIPVYALLIRAERRTIEDVPEVYQVPVAEHMAEQIEEN